MGGEQWAAPARPCEDLRALPGPETLRQPFWAAPHSAPTHGYFEGSGPDGVTCSAPQPRQNGAERSLSVGGCVGKNAAKAIKTRKEPPENVKHLPPPRISQTRCHWWISSTPRVRAALYTSARKAKVSASVHSHAALSLLSTRSTKPQNYLQRFVWA